MLPFVSSKTFTLRYPLTVSICYMRKHVHNEKRFLENTGQSQKGFKLYNYALQCYYAVSSGIARAERDGTPAETRFRLSPKRKSPFKSVGASVQSTAGSRGVRISLSNVGYTTFGGGVRVLATNSIRQFLLNFPSRASPFATTFRTSSNFLPILES